MELCRDTFVLDGRAIVSSRKCFALSFVGVGVDVPEADMSDETADTPDKERVGAEAGKGRSVKVARLLTDALRASRPLTAAPSLIQP